MTEHQPHKIEKSAWLTIFGIILLFSSAVFITLIAPRYVDPSWTEPTSPYQVQMYTISDPNFYISSGSSKGLELEYVYHVKRDFSLLAFDESETFRILAPPELEKYVTRYKEPKLKLTSQLLLLRPPQDKEAETAMRQTLQKEWEEKRSEETSLPRFTILELFDPQEEQAFALATTEGVLESWVDKDFVILEETPKQAYHQAPGVIYIKNPEEYRVSTFEGGWVFDPEGQSINTLSELKGPPFSFRSREELIKEGEHIYAIEGCWYCHTDQTRTVIQDLVLNGSDSYPAPPSTGNEYIFQKITFPGTRRIGPDLSRVGVKRPSRDWHKSHFWSPKTESKGSIMPAMRHFFDEDPSGKTPGANVSIPNHKFEAVFQYLMTKGTRITPPTEAWWLGKDPVKTKLVIEGKATVKP